MNLSLRDQLSLTCFYSQISCQNPWRWDVMCMPFIPIFQRHSTELTMSCCYKRYVTGVHGRLWLRSYLCDRTQIVRVHNFKSFKIDVPLVVPQGSHLGPLLFNLFVNDISSCFSHSHFLMFADDLNFFLIIQDPSDCFKLQMDLDHLAQQYRQMSPNYLQPKQESHSTCL